MPIIKLKNDEQILLIDEANRTVHAVLDYIEEKIQSGMSTCELNDLAVEKLQEFKGATAAFKGYRGFPKSICTSVNGVVVHGIPSEYELRDGDIVGVDFGVRQNGVVGDAARTFVIGNISDDIKNLVENTKIALYNGIAEMKDSNRLYDINNAIASIAKLNNYGIVKGYCGHGVGEQMHEDPHVYNYVESAEPNVRLRAGMVMALEPMFTLGASDVRVMKDGWSVTTVDGKPSCHWELSIAITKNGPKILGK